MLQTWASAPEYYRCRVLIQTFTETLFFFLMAVLIFLLAQRKKSEFAAKRAANTLRGSANTLRSFVGIAVAGLRWELSEKRPDSDRRWFRSSVGAAAGLAALVSLVITLTHVFGYGASFGAIFYSDYTVIVGIIAFEHLIFCYPYALYLRRKIRLGSPRAGTHKGGMVGLLLSLIIVDGFIILAHIVSIGDPRGGEVAQLLLPVYFVLWPPLALVATFVGFGVGEFIDSQSRE